MTNEQAIRHLEDLQRLYLGNEKFTADIEAIGMAIKALEQTRWIPCSERLPEKAKARYWICTDGGYQCQCRWTNDVYGLGEGDRWAWKIFDIPQYSKVVAWMPLPKPYKAETKIEQGLNFADQDTMMPAT